MELLKTNKFEILDMPGMNTIAFVVGVDNDNIENQEKVLSLSKVEPSVIDMGEKSKKVFSVANENGTDKDLMVLLTLSASKVILNTGELTSNGFEIKENNIPLKYEKILSENELEYKEIEYTPNLKRKFSIIDAEDGSEVKPLLYMDEKTGEIKGKCKIMPNKPYVVLELKLD